MGSETSKARARRLRSGYFHRYLCGKGIDIGCGDDPITPDCLHWDLAQGDAATLPGLKPAEFDWVYSSHCLEDLPDPAAALARWWEVLKPGGYLLVAVPDEDLYEQGGWPSRFNAGHRWTFTGHKSGSWSPVSRNLVDLVRELPAHELISLRRCDDGYDYDGGVWDRTHGPAEAGLEVLVRKTGSIPEGKDLPSGGWETAFGGLAAGGAVSLEPLKIYTGILGQIGDIVMFTATARRLKELFPNGTLTFAVSRKYQEAGELVAGLPYVDRLFVTERYFEGLTPERSAPWELGWPVDLRGEDEVAEQRRHDLVLETRPRHRRMPWWRFAHQVEETAHMVRVPGPIDLRTEIRIPAGTRIPEGAAEKIVFHNDPSIDATKAWPAEHARRFIEAVGPANVVLLGSRGEHDPMGEVPGVLDLRGRTSLREAAAIIRDCRVYVGIDSGLMWIAGSLQAPVVGLYGTSYIPAFGAIQPVNPRAVYLQAEGGLESIAPEAVLAAMNARGGPPPQPGRAS